MVNNAFIDSLGIEKEKADALKDALRKDSASVPRTGASTAFLDAFAIKISLWF